MHLPRLERLAAERVVGVLELGAVRGRGRDRNDGGVGGADERGLNAVERLDRRSVARQAGDARLGRVEVEDRHRHREQHGGGCSGGDHRMAERRGEHLRPHAVLAARAAQPAEERDAALLDAVAELRQERREHGERAEHRDRDDHDRADAERAERAVAGEEQPGHRGHDRQPGDEHRAARRRSCGLERGTMAAACGTLFTLTLEVEERVVDADGEPDQEDDLRDRLVHRHQPAGERQEADRREHRGEREQERHACGDDRAEHEHEDEQGQRDRADADLCELLVEHRVQRLVGARAAGLADVEARMTLRHGGGGRRDRVDVLLRDGVVALHVPPDDRGVAVGGDLIAVRRIERRAEVLDRLEGRDRPGDVRDRSAEGAVLDRERLALDEHELRLRVGLAEAGLLEDLVGAMRLADVRGPAVAIVFIGSCVAMPNATTTNASQPKTAVFQ